MSNVTSHDVPPQIRSARLPVEPMVERVGWHGSVYDQEAMVLGEGHTLERSGLDLGDDRQE